MTLAGAYVQIKSPGGGTEGVLSGYQGGNTGKVGTKGVPLGYGGVWRG